MGALIISKAELAYCETVKGTLEILGIFTLTWDRIRIPQNAEQHGGDVNSMLKKLNNKAFTWIKWPTRIANDGVQNRNCIHVCKKFCTFNFNLKN